jgi:hypothetical protein
MLIIEDLSLFELLVQKNPAHYIDNDKLTTAKPPPMVLLEPTMVSKQIKFDGKFAGKFDDLHQPICFSDDFIRRNQYSKLADSNLSMQNVNLPANLPSNLICSDTLYCDHNVHASFRSSKETEPCPRHCQF